MAYEYAIKSRVLSATGRENYDRIFGKKKKPAVEPTTRDSHAEQTEAQEMIDSTRN